MEIFSWGTAICAFGTALFLAPNISIFFRAVDQGLREQSNDNAVLVQAKRQDEIFRACLSFQLRNPIYAMEARIRNLQQQQQQQLDNSQVARSSEDDRGGSNNNDKYHDALKEIESLRKSLLTIVNSGLDPEVSTMIMDTRTTTRQPTDPISSEEQQSLCFFDIRRLVQQAISVIQLERERQRGVSSVVDAVARDNQDIDEEEDPSHLPLVWQGGVDETTLPNHGAILYGNVAHVSQILYNLFSHAVSVQTNENDIDIDRLIVKYHVSLVDYNEALQRGTISKPLGWNEYRSDKNFAPAVLAIRILGLNANDVEMGNLGADPFHNNNTATRSSLSLRVASELVHGSGGSIQCETNPRKTSNANSKDIAEFSIVSHVVVRVERWV